MAEIISEIIDAEREADKIKENAAKKHVELISEAKIKAKKLIDDKTKLLEVDKNKEIEKIKIDNKEIRKNIIAENEKKAKLLKKVSNEYHSKAVDFLLEKFMESLS